jgi:hypothetical protein
VKRVLEMVEKHEFAAEKPYQDLAMDLIALGDCDEALRIIRRIGTDPVQHPHPVDLAGKIDLLGSLAVALNKAGRGDEARKVLREALVSVEGDPRLANRRGFIAFYQARMGDGDGALQTLEAVDFDERVQVLSEIADEQLKAGNVENARTTLRRALGAVEKQLEDPVSGAQRKGLVEVDGNGRPRPATIDPAVFKDRYLGRLAGFQARVGNLSGAVQTLAKITSEHDRVLAWAISPRPERGQGTRRGH